MKYPYIINDLKIILYDSTKSYIVYKEDSEYESILKSIKENKEEEITTFIENKNKYINILSGKILSENIIYKDGTICYNNIGLNNTITKKIIQMIEDDYKDLTPIVNFMENLMKNPSKRAIDELYGFLEYANLPLTEDGHFIAYKKVQSNFKDIYSGTIDNSVGSKVKMLRGLVNDDKEQTCSTGLHFCSKEYLSKFGTSPSNVVVLLKINPMNVVSIPIDYNNTKGRCCEYEVIDTYIDDTLLEEKSIYIENEYINEEYEDEEEEEDEDEYEEDKKLKRKKLKDDNDYEDNENDHPF